MGGENRTSTIRALEAAAEQLVVYHLDLLAQIEAQLRTAHHTMRRIDRLRTARRRSGLELTDGQRQATLTTLSQEVTALDDHLRAEHECCVLMHETIKQMQARLTDLKESAARLDNDSEPDPSNQGLH
jgi:hypothetical protein